MAKYAVTHATDPAPAENLPPKDPVRYFAWTGNRSDFLIQSVTWFFLGFVLVFSVVRAKIQPIAHDEALTYVSYASDGIGQMFKFSPNNHILFTLAAAWFTRLFGLREFILRAPTLGGLCAYLIGSYFLCRRIFGLTLFLPITVLLLIANPVILDFMVAARGYGLGLGLLMCAMAIFASLSVSGMRIDPDKWRWKCALGAICLGLAVAANLSFAVPAATLGLAFAVISVASAPAKNESVFRKVGLLALWLILPALVAASVFLLPYLWQARVASYQFGYEKLSIFLRELFNSSFLYKWTDDTYANLGANPIAPGSWQRTVSDFGVIIVLPLLTLAVITGLAYGLWKTRWPDAEDKSPYQLFCGATTGCMVLLFLLHFVLQNKYPVVRGCLYLIPLLTVSVALALRAIARSFPVVRASCLVLSLLIAADYLMTLQTSTFRYNVYDARSREAFFSILNDVRSRHFANQVRVGGTWWYQPEMNFYRTLYKADQIAVYDIKDSSVPFVEQNSLRPGDYDYFCFVQDKRPDFENRLPRAIFFDAKTGITIVAVDQSSL